MKNKKQTIAQQMIARGINPLHPEKKLVTRRDFLSSGVLGFSGSVILPSIFDIVLTERAARAGVCPSGTPFSGMIPFLVFDCAGGAALSGNWVMTDAPGKNGQPLGSGYNTLGLGMGRFNADYQFGAPMAGPLVPTPDLESQIFMKLTDDTVLPPEVRACLRMGVIAHTSLSDIGTNELSAVSMITSAGMQGNRIKNGLGNGTGDSAGNSAAASFNPAYRPMAIKTVDSLTTALSYGTAFAETSTTRRDALAHALSRLSSSQGRALASMTLGDQFASLAQAGYDANAQVTGAFSSVDARQDSAVSAIYSLSGKSSTNQDVIIATLVKNAVERASGPAVITIGGCDYHTGARTNGDAKDGEIGTRLAQALRVAYAKCTPVAFQIFTDGGIYSDANRNWMGDDNDKSASIFGIMDPTGPREMVSYQLGSYTTEGGANRNDYLATNPTLVAHTVLLNYLALHGQKSRYMLAANDPRISLDPSKIDSLLLFPDKA